MKRTQQETLALLRARLHAGRIEKRTTLKRQGSKEQANGLELLLQHAEAQDALAKASIPVPESSLAAKRAAVLKERRELERREKEAQKLGAISSRRLLWRLLSDTQSPEWCAKHPAPKPTERENTVSLMPQLFKKPSEPRGKKEQE